MAICSSSRGGRVGDTGNIPEPLMGDKEGGVIGEAGFDFVFSILNHERLSGRSGWPDRRRVGRS